MEQNIDNKRLIYLDYLRVIATLAIVLIHIVAPGMGNLNIKSFDWNFLNALNCIARWGTPIFLMISGALFLGKDIPLEKLYKKNILRLVLVYLLWNVLYIACYAATGPITLNRAVYLLFFGEFHMWFLPMIICIYMCIPFLRPIVKDKNLLDYYIVLGFIFTFIIPEIYSLLMSFTGGITYQILDGLVKRQFVKLDMLTTNIYFFVLGYYLNTFEIQPDKRKQIYLWGLLGFAATIALTVILSQYDGKPNLKFYFRGSLNVALEAIFLFVLCRYTDWNNKGLNNLMIKLSKYTFGVYLMHILVRNLVTNTSFIAKFFKAIPVTPRTLLYFAVVVILCFGFSFILKQMPGIKKWIY